MIGAPRDQFGRGIDYLRISVTDKCNFRCLYCMPSTGLEWLPKAEILTYEEIAGIVARLASAGVSRLRITGGEPTIRPDLERLITLLRAIPGIRDIALSTNGVKLAGLAPVYASAGLDRVNISSDSLRPDRISRIARRNTDFNPVEAALAAERAGLAPVKINVVVMRGINDDELHDFARLTLEHPWHVRFIELMPVGELRDLTWKHVVPSDEIIESLASLGDLADDRGPAGNGPAVYHRYRGAPGTVGVITPMTHTFCGQCNRVRLTADGRLRTCLFGDHEVNLRDAWRSGEDVVPLFFDALASKPREHALLEMKTGGLRALSQTGG
jgi:cyclic pyranopterin phosphate synthase